MQGFPDADPRQHPHDERHQDIEGKPKPPRTENTYGMTNDELRSFILDRLAPSLEQAWRERDTLAERAESSRQEAEREREARKKAEKDAADREKENAALRKALEDERNKNKTHVRNKFGSSSRRSRTAKGISPAVTDRSQEKEGFDGEASCILRSLIETCKLWKVSVCEYLNRIFTAFSVGRTDYDNMMHLGLTTRNSNFASESQSYDLLTPSFNLRELNHTNQINKKIIVL